MERDTWFLGSSFGEPRIVYNEQPEYDRKFVIIDKDLLKIELPTQHPGKRQKVDLYKQNWPLDLCDVFYSYKWILEHTVVSQPETANLLKSFQYSFISSQIFARNQLRGEIFFFSCRSLYLLVHSFVKGLQKIYISLVNLK